MSNSAGDTPTAAARRWGPDRRLRWFSLAATVGCLVWIVFDSDKENRLVAGIIAIAGILVALALTRVRVRLAADPAGLTIVGPLRSRTIAWPDIASISAERRGRFGRRGASLEIEIFDESGTTDDVFPGSAAMPVPDDPAAAEARSIRDARSGTELLVFGSLELGTDPAAVGRALRRLKP